MTTTPTLAPGGPTPPADHAPRGPGRTALRLVLVAGSIAMILMWVGIFTNYFAKTAPGTLDSRMFAEAAQPICAGAKTKLDGLKKAFQTTNNVARANEVAKSNVILRDMLGQLRLIVPTTGRDGKMTQEWLADWSTYVGNREDYVNRLRADPRARFLESPKSSATEQISKPIDRFTYVNKMDSCDTPKDMA